MKKYSYVILALFIMCLTLSAKKIREKDILKLKPVKILKQKRIVIGRIKKRLKINYKLTISPEKLIIGDEAKVEITALNSKNRVIHNFKNPKLIIFLTDYDIHNFKLRNLKMDKWGNFYIPENKFKNGKYVFYITYEKPISDIGILIKDNDKIFNSLDTGVSLKWNFGDFYSFKIFADKTNITAGDTIQLIFKPVDKFNNNLTNFIIPETIMLEFIPKIFTNLLFVDKGEYKNTENFVFNITPTLATSNLELSLYGEESKKLYSSKYKFSIKPLKPFNIQISTISNYAIDKTNIIYYKILDKFENFVFDIQDIKVVALNKNINFYDYQKSVINTNLPIESNKYFYFTCKKPGTYSLSLICNNLITNNFKVNVLPGLAKKVKISLLNNVTNNEFFKIDLTFLDKYNNKTKLNDYLYIDSTNKLSFYDKNTNIIQTPVFITNSFYSLVLKNRDNNKEIIIRFNFKNNNTNFIISSEPAKFSHLILKISENNFLVENYTNELIITAYNTLNKKMDYFTNNIYLIVRSNRMNFFDANISKVNKNKYLCKFYNKNNGEVLVHLMPNLQGLAIINLNYNSFITNYYIKVLPEIYGDLKNTLIREFYINSNVKIKDFFQLISLPQKYINVYFKLNNVTNENLVLKKGDKIQVPIPVIKTNNRYAYKYKVKKEDTLYKLGKLFYNSDDWSEIFYFNKIKAIKDERYKYIYLIYPKKYLYIPVE